MLYPNDKVVRALILRALILRALIDLPIGCSRMTNVSVFPAFHHEVRITWPDFSSIVSEHYTVKA